jgi:ABC-2 type transport system permease protein
LGGVFFPNAIMPKGLAYISEALPATSVNDALRAVAVMGMGLSDIWKELAIIVGWLVACLVISIRFFRWE